MNYLAHIYLADNNDKSMLGNFLGDFVNKALENEFEYDIRSGIYMHRKLDSFTDSNPFVLESKKRISKENRRFAGVLVDLFYDHFLAKNWSEYSSIPLEEYADNFYGILKRHSSSLPDKLLRRMPVMIEENWLLSYKDISGIEKALERIARKFSESSRPLVDPVDELMRNYKSLQNDFQSFFPCAIECADKLKG
ncbi:MAG: ACP phosphodiesterase [Clostridiaceae bacterium]